MNEKKLLEGQLKRLLEWQKKYSKLEIEWGKLQMKTSASAPEYKEIYEQHERSKEFLLQINDRLKTVSNQLNALHLKKPKISRTKTRRH